MTDLEKLKAARNAELDAAYAAWVAAVSSANGIYFTALAAFDAALEATLAAQEKGQTDD
jgi:hypothetical protein